MFEEKMSEEINFGKKNNSKTLKRRSSLEKIMYICNQGYQVFPLVFIRVHDFPTTFSGDLRKLIPFIKSLLVLRLGVYLSVFCLSLELLCCLMFILKLTMAYGILFFFTCVGILTVLAFQIFDVVSCFRRKIFDSFFVKKKID